MNFWDKLKLLFFGEIECLEVEEPIHYGDIITNFYEDYNQIKYSNDLRLMNIHSGTSKEFFEDSTEIDTELNFSFESQANEAISEEIVRTSYYWKGDDD